MFEYFDHTADIGICVRAPNLPQLYAEAAAALSGLIVADLGAVQPRESVSLRITGADREYLLFDWLNELLYLFEGRRLVLSRFDVKLDEAGLEAEVRGEPFDAGRHRPHHEVKAVTYHELSVRERNGEWEARVILDI